jgi:hypothetical protein
VRTASTTPESALLAASATMPTSRSQREVIKHRPCVRT